MSTPDDLGHGPPPRPAPLDFHPTAPSSGPPQVPPRPTNGYGVPLPPQPHAAEPNAAQPQFVIAAPTGLFAWGLGLLVLTLIPFLSPLLASGGMIVAGLRQRPGGELAAANGRNAANWGLTYLILTVLLLGGFYTSMIQLPEDSPLQKTFFPVGGFLLLWVIVTIAHVVFSVVGMVVSSRRKVFRAPAIPFFPRRPALAAGPDERTGHVRAFPSG